MRVVTDNIGFLLGGLLITLELTAIGFVGALLLGTVLAVFRVSPIPPLRAAGAVYVEVLRNMPLLSLLILVVFGLPDIGLTFSLFTSAALCLAAFGAAFVCEAVRGGINTVPVGQAEAARSLGFTFTQSLLYVILPPAFRRMVQPLVNIFIGIALSSSLAAAVGVSELTNRTQVLNLQSAEAVARNSPRASARTSSLDAPFTSVSMLFRAEQRASPFGLLPLCGVPKDNCSPKAFQNRCREGTKRSPKGRMPLRPANPGTLGPRNQSPRSRPIVAALPALRRVIPQPVQAEERAGRESSLSHRGSRSRDAA